MIRVNDWFKEAEALKHETLAGGVSLHCCSQCCRRRGFHGGYNETHKLCGDSGHSLALCQHCLFPFLNVFPATCPLQQSVESRNRYSQFGCESKLVNFHQGNLLSGSMKAAEVRLLCPRCRPVRSGISTGWASTYMCFEMSLGLQRVLFPPHSCLLDVRASIAPTMQSCSRPKALQTLLSPIAQLPIREGCSRPYLMQ